MHSDGTRESRLQRSCPVAIRVPLSDVERFSIGRVFMEFGESARMIQEEILAMAHCLGCNSAEVYCQHAAIIVTLRRGEGGSSGSLS